MIKKRWTVRQSLTALCGGKAARLLPSAFWKRHPIGRVLRA